MDGRDVSPTSGIAFVSELFHKTKEIGVGTIATVWADATAWTARRSTVERLTTPSKCDAF